jgi:hypothetical protein
MSKYLLFLLAVSAFGQGQVGGVQQPAGVISAGTFVASSVPPQAAAVGYNTQTFYSSMAAADFDLAEAYTTGKKWYLGNFQGSTPPPSATVTFGQNYAVVGGNNATSIICTAGASGAPGTGLWVGTAFGGGAYFEAEFAFDPAQTAANNGSVGGGYGSWPAFWSDTLEQFLTMTPVVDQWPGQATGYESYVEPDFFEYQSGGAIGSVEQFGSSIHQGYGIWNSTCPPGYCVITASENGTAPTGTRWTEYHRLGALWVPATVSTSGYMSFYLDGVLYNTVTWTKFVAQAPPPTAQPWAYGVMDLRHLVVMFDTGPNQPFSVRYMGVWQANGSGNLVH